LLIGSEGTLGIITELTVRLFPVPESIRAAVATFPTIQSACETVIEAIQSGLSLARIELLDAVQIGAINAYSKLTLAEAPTLFIELHGSCEGTAAELSRLAELAEGHGGTGLSHASGEPERRQLWKARHDAFLAVRAAWPGREALVTDVCVPISKLARCVAETEADIRRHGLTAPIVGHVGDGNFHAIVLFNPANPAELEAVAQFAARLADRAIGLDGTCTGEHGIGQGKRSALVNEAGAGLEVMRQIKKALDPAGILNPGKML
jgi:D-lactate dehydrogenase (cytochrome)